LFASAPTAKADAKGNEETDEKGNVADGESEDFPLVKAGLRNDEDYGPDSLDTAKGEEEEDAKDNDETETKVKKAEDESENETESEAEPETGGDPDEDGDEARDEVAPSTPANLKQPPAKEGQEIIDIAELPHLPPVMPRFVIHKDGRKEVCYATLPGREYYSDDIKDAVFDDAQCEPPYVDWTVGVTERMSASKALVKRYNKYSPPKISSLLREKRSQQRLENKNCARVI
jgi:hypothetical protein